MKTLKELMNEARGKERVVGTFVKDPDTKIIVKKGRFGGMTRLTVYVADGFGQQVIKRGLDTKMTDAEIADEIKNGSWAKQFKAAGGVKWAK